MKDLRREILNIAIPSIVSNITVPLLGLVDVAIVGHLGAASYIGAIAIGGMIFNMVYWLLGFLRMGTSGMTAQAYGAGRFGEAEQTLRRSMTVAMGMALVLIVLQKPLLGAMLWFYDAQPQVDVLVEQYFNILIWGAPAALGVNSLNGWFIGMQNARYPMTVAIVQNVTNIIASLFFVFALGWKVEGVAAGTLVAQWTGLVLAVILVQRMPQINGRRAFRPIADIPMRFFSVNRDIFLRTLCLVAVTVSFTKAGASIGEVILAVNAVLMEFYLLVSYVMDGFANAAEAISGAVMGAGDRGRFRLLLRQVFTYSGLLAVVFTLVYALFGGVFVGLLTDDAEVTAVAATYLPYAVAVPVVGFAAFILDGIFVGTTSSGYMLFSAAIAAAFYFAVYFLFSPSFQNHALWMAFLVYIGARGVVQLVLLPSVRRKIAK